MADAYGRPVRKAQPARVVLMTPPQVWGAVLHCRSSLLAVFAPQALLLSLAAKLRTSKSGNLAKPPRHPSYAPRYPRADRAAGFLGACFPSAPGSAWGTKQVNAPHHVFEHFACPHFVNAASDCRALQTVNARPELRAAACTETFTVVFSSTAFCFCFFDYLVLSMVQRDIVMSIMQ